MARGYLSQGVTEAPQMKGSRSWAEGQWVVRGQQVASVAAGCWAWTAEG